MACARCTAARQAASRTLRSAASGNLRAAVQSARTVVVEIAAKVAENDRIRNLTRRKPHG